MPTPEIIERVKQLHDDLSATQPDPARQPAVDELKAELQTVMLEPDHAPHYKSLSDKLLFHYVGFQIDHPKLAGSMQGLVESLARAGL